MRYTIHSEPQGSDEWLAGRNTRLNASELVLAGGDSMNGRTRTDLIRKMATGIEPDVDAFTRKLYAEGHRFEALARPLAEQIIGRDLYPITASIEVPGLRRRLGASLDGATDDDSDNFEHKRMNAALRDALAHGVIPGEYHWQMEQGQMINGATRTLFMASEWDDDDNLLEEMHVWYESNPMLRARIIPVWRQTEDDAANYKHVESSPVTVAAPVADLPVLFVQARGEVTSTNMPSFKVAVSGFLGSLNMKPTTDQEFADSKAIASKLREGAKALLAKKSEMLAQTASIGDVASECDAISKQMNAAALALEKEVEREELNRKGRLTQLGQDQFAAHIAALEKRIGIRMPAVPADFAKAIKGKSKLESMENGIATELARAKIAANELADKIDANMTRYTELAAGYEFLFRDIETLAVKDADGFEAIVLQRINQHAESERKRLEAEREKIRAEEEAKATAKVKAEQEEAERQRKAAEAAAAKIMSDRATEAAMEEHRTLAAGRAATEPAPQPAHAASRMLEETAAGAGQIDGCGAEIKVIAANQGITGSARLLDRLDDLARMMTDAELSALCIHAAHMLENRRAAA